VCALSYAGGGLPSDISGAAACCRSSSAQCAASERELLPVAAAGLFSGIFGERLGKKNLQISSKIMSERRVYSCERCGVRGRAGSYQTPVNYAS
jgi:hypothetical protein